MLVLLYLFWFQVGEPTLAGFIAGVDACCSISSAIAAVVVFYLTNPKNKVCLERDGDGYSTNISLVTFVVFSIIQLLLGGILRLPKRVFGIFNRLLSLLGYKRCNISSCMASGIFLERSIDIFFDTWIFVLVFDIALWSQTEYQDFTNLRTASIGMIPVYLRAYSIFGLVDNACKAFTGQFDGVKMTSYHGGVPEFAQFWSNMWFPQFLIAMSAIVYFADIAYIGAIGTQTYTRMDANLSNLIVLAVDAVVMITLVELVRLVQKHEYEVLQVCHLFGGQSKAGNVISYSAIYIKLYRFFDVLKMVLAIQFIIILSNIVPVMEWAFPNYTPNPISQLLIYCLGLCTPIAYNLLYHCCVLLRNEENATQLTRFIMIFVMLAATHIACAFIGAFRGCDKLRNLSKKGYLDLDTMNDSLSFVVYFAKANAIPTTLGFGLVFFSSPAAARYSSTWSSLPLPLQCILAPMPWLTPHIFRSVHVASGTIFLMGGMYHASCWITVYASKFLTEFPKGYFIAICTGVVMICPLGIKLLWPPGMDGLSAKYVNTFGCLKGWDKFNMDSKYGSAHVYIANIVFVLYMVHATYAQYPMWIYYWTFPLIAFVFLFLLHPSKSTYFLKKMQVLMSKDTFDRSFGTLRKTSEDIKSVGKRASLNDVTLTLSLPTYDTMFDEISRGQEYTGFCDVIMVKFRNPGQWLWRELETVHYYSVVGIRTSKRPGEIDVNLMIQKTKRSDGCSAMLACKMQDSIASCEEFIEVIGFVKSNALDSVNTPAIIAFGWESGAAAFCSLFKYRLDKSGTSKDMSLKRTKVLSIVQSQIGAHWTPREGLSGGDCGPSAVLAVLQRLCPKCPYGNEQDVRNAFADFMYTQDVEAFESEVRDKDGLFRPYEDTHRKENESEVDYKARLVDLLRHSESSKSGPVIWFNQQACINAVALGLRSCFGKGEGDDLKYYYPGEKYTYQVTDRDTFLGNREAFHMTEAVILHNNRNHYTAYVRNNKDAPEVPLPLSKNPAPVKEDSDEKSSETVKQEPPKDGESEPQEGQHRSSKSKEGGHLPGGGNDKIPFEDPAGGAADPEKNVKKVESAAAEVDSDSAFSKDLMVIWVPFGSYPRAQGPGHTDATKVDYICQFIRNLANMQRYVLEKSGGSGAKLLFVVTGVPVHWTLYEERVANVPAYDLSGHVAKHFGIKTKSVNNKDNSSDDNGAVKNVLHDDDSAGIESRRSDSSVDPSVSLMRDNLDTLNGKTFEENIILARNCQSSWIPFRNYHNSKIFLKSLQNRMTASLTWLHDDDYSSAVSRVCSLFSTENDTDSNVLRTFKYSVVYNMVNKCILQTQLRFLKNPNDFLKGNFDATDKDPVHSKTISCDVLYSGDYASPKLDQLKVVVDEISLEQNSKRRPASLGFVPDA